MPVTPTAFLCVSAECDCSCEAAWMKCTHGESLFLRSLDKLPSCFYCSWLKNLMQPYFTSPFSGHWGRVQVCAYRKIRRIDSCQCGWIQADLRLMQINYANNVNIHILVLIILNSYYFTDKYQFTKCTLLHLFVNVVHKGTRLSVETSIVLL